ncbi:MAG: hypothetical protein KF824_07380 [Fimbriimonadaceae bacterium]|nr:MAG: hypothetical protein KF824_07380 [Fimbriimonadaceae bacterium]
MAARKKADAATTEAKVPAAKRVKKAPTAAPTDAVTPELLSQLLAQVQQLTQEVTELRSQSQPDAPVVEETTTEEVAQEIAEVVEEPVSEIVQSEEIIEDDEEDAITPEEASALLEGFDQVMAEPSPEHTETEPTVSVDETDEDAPMTDDQIAALLSQAQHLSDAPQAEEEVSSTSFESAEQPSEMLSTDISDDDIAAALEQGAEYSAPTATNEPIEEVVDEEDDFDFASLTEEDLAAMVRQSIENQSEEREQLAAQTGTNTSQLEAMLAESNSDVMSADHIASLLEQPDPEGEIVPSESVAMDDDEISRLLAEANALGGAPASPLTADDLGSLLQAQQTFEPQAKSEPVHPAAVAQSVQQRSSSNEFDLGAVKAIPSHLAIRALALPVCFQEGKILCRVAEPVDRVAVDRMSKAVGLGIVIEPASVAEVVNGLREVYAEVSEVHARFAMMSGAQKRVGSWEKFSHLWKKGA